MGWRRSAAATRRNLCPGRGNAVKRSALVVVLAAFGGSLAASSAGAGEGGLRVSHRGITLMTVPPAPAVDYDIEVIGGRQALDKIRDALDALLDNSPYSAAAIEKLIGNGEVFIVYDPSYPDKVVSNFLGVTLAAFQPNLFDNAGGKAGAIEFPVVVGRYLVKWPRDEVAGVLAHELVGHGTQHLQGRLATIGDRDTECEANLYKEKAHQDLGTNVRSLSMVRFRRDLHWVWCAEFKRYMTQHRPALMGLWTRLNPDVPGLLAVFKEYMSDRIDPDELTAWKEVVGSSERSDFEKFLDDYPNGYFSARAKRRRAALAPPPVAAPSGTAAQPGVGAYPRTLDSGEPQ